MKRRIASLFLSALAFFAAPALAAPPGWELRNGSWVPIIPPSNDTPEGQVAQMIVDLNQGRTKDVIYNAKNWRTYNSQHPLAPQVILLQGDAESMSGDRYQALYSYEDLLNNYPTSELYVPTLQREYDIADTFLKGYKRTFFWFIKFSVEDDAIELLYRIQDRQRGSPMAEKAALRIADHYYSQGEFQDAVDAYGDLLKRYPYSQYARKAEVRRAEASIATFKGVLFDMTPLLDARERLKVIEQVFPKTAENIQVNALFDHIYQLEGNKELEIARYYWRAGKKYASSYYYKRVITNWPGTLHAEAALKEFRQRFPRESIQ
jgi:outer membrane protein assembly factor BamD